MSVSFENENYRQYKKMWKLCRDVCRGSDAVKSGRTLYLPKPSGMDDVEYDSYLARAEFFPATNRTLDGLHGLLNMKPLLINADNKEDIEQYFENVDGEGTSLQKFANDISYDCLITGWGGILCDAPDETGKSKREAESQGISPYMTFYPAESIINVQTTRANRLKKTSLIVLKEFVSIATNDKFQMTPKIHYRVLELDEYGEYIQTEYDENEQEIKRIKPLKYGKPMTEIPFYFIPSRTPYISLLNQVADVNIAHFRKSADYENALHWTGIPTPYVSGESPETEIVNGEEVAKPLTLGGTQMLYFPDGGHPGFLEFSGSGCNTIRQAMLDDEERMAILGARIISAEKKGTETAETARIHRASENSVLATFAREISDGLSKAVRNYLECTLGKEIDCAVALNTDYDVARLQPAELTSLVSLWQGGAISRRTLFENLQQGEIISSTKSFDDEMSEIDEESAAPAQVIE